MHEGISSKVERTPSEEFQDQLHNILYTPLSVETIGQFADDALNKLINLNESVVHRYQQEYPESDALSGAGLEDAAYAAYELENLGTVLDRITAVRDRIAVIAQRVQESLSQTNSVIVPPDEIGPAFQDTGSGSYEAPDKLNRLITLAYILETDFDLDRASVRYTQGTTTDAMVRQEPYVRVEINDLNRVVYVCDEEGNASYVFDTKVLEHLSIDLLELDKMTKNGRNAFLRLTPEAGRRIVQSPAWRSVVSQALREPFASDGKVPVPTEVVPRSEFVERGQFLNFEDFEAEVQAAYEEAGRPGRIFNWYRYEYIKHIGWPSNPNGKYKDSGWKSYPELVGLEKNDILEFAEFVAEVQAAYQISGASQDSYTWYQKEKKNHSGWPSDPRSSYHSKGWLGYPHLVGNEKVEFLEFKDFVSEVQSAHETAGKPRDVSKWYMQEYKNHTGWPAAPDRSYKNKGWLGFPELAGRERVEYLEFTDFVQQVRVAYMVSGTTNIPEWYREEYKNHPGWPAAPGRFYKDNGWLGYPQLIGREKVDFLKFSDFVQEVRLAYEKAGSPSRTQEWYREEYKNHPGWPSNPNSTYKNEGWVSYSELLSKRLPDR